MPLVTRILTTLSTRIERRLATKASRFSLAVSTGFVIAFVGFVSVGLDRAGFAEGLAGLFGSGFSGNQSFFGQPQYQYATQTSQAEVPIRPRHRQHVARRHGGEMTRAVRADGDNPVPLARRSMCVRLCDGYAFPVGNYHGEGDRASHEATCHSECPGAETALYVLPAGSDSIAQSVRVGSSQNYSDLPDAFHYSTVLDDACTCHPAGGNRIKSLLHDFTLRRGDAVMTQTGFKVFHGGRQFPYKRRDFVALARSPDIRKSDRATFRAIERASLSAATTVAQRPQPAPAFSDRRDGTKLLEHQASR